VLYSLESGLILSTFDGYLKNYDAMDFKLVWDHYENQLDFVEKTTITVCEYS